MNKDVKGDNDEDDMNLIGDEERIKQQVNIHSQQQQQQSQNQQQYMGQQQQYRGPPQYPQQQNMGQPQQYMGQQPQFMGQQQQQQYLGQQPQFMGQQQNMGQQPQFMGQQPQFMGQPNQQQYMNPQMLMQNPQMATNHGNIQLNHDEREIFPNSVETNYGCYESCLQCCGGIFGTCRTWLPCICCCVEYPFKQIDQGEEGLLERFGKFTRIITPSLQYMNPFTEKIKKV